MSTGRVGGSRPALSLRVALRACATGVALACVASCAAPPRDADHPALGEVWRDYQALPEHRALAVAGELRHRRWVAGASGGHAAEAEAQEAALRECARRRLERRLQAPCRLYASGPRLLESLESP